MSRSSSPARSAIVISSTRVATPSFWRIEDVWFSTVRPEHLRDLAERQATLEQRQDLELAVREHGERSEVDQVGLDDLEVPIVRVVLAPVRHDEEAIDAPVVLERVDRRLDLHAEAHVPDDEPRLVKRMVELAEQYGRYG